MWQIRKVTIPDDLDFSDLHLSRDFDGSVIFDGSVVERICKANGLPVELSDANVARLVITWYQTHRQDGGDPDPIAEDFITEALADESVEQMVSYKLGNSRQGFLI